MIDVWCPRCGAEYREGVVRCTDSNLTLIKNAPAWADDPETLRDIDRRYRSRTVREWVHGRSRVDVGRAWRLSGSLHPAHQWPGNSLAGVTLRIPRTAWYLIVGVPNNRLAKAKRLAKGPWIDPPSSL